jgi:transcriptional regulator with AAA-type ATPase domain/tetratricopeptide (TPR) repeat protein
VGSTPDEPFLPELIGEHPHIEAVREQVRRLVQGRGASLREPPILIQGETGTGKGLLARAIHRAGRRAAGPFVDVNCAAIPDTLLEAELFGFERGAFTDARHAKPGLFQAAHQGTMFLDEIGLLPVGLQGKILSVLEAGAVRRLGRTQSEPVDVAIVTATSEDLVGAVREGRFRQDLYHRLAVVVFRLPPLTARGPDIVRLAEHFLQRASAEYGRPPRSLDAQAREALCSYEWPGNLRELSNVMERIVLLSEESVITPKVLDLPASPPEVAPPTLQRGPIRELVGALERAHLLEALRATNWNVSHAAARLGLSRGNLRYRMEKYGLRSQRGSPRAASSAEAGSPIPTEPTVAPVGRWEQRYVALLRVAVVAPAVHEEPPAAVGVIADVVEKLESFGGHIEEMSPTGVLAGFGLESAEDAAWRAAQAALAIETMGERARRAGRSRAEVAIGIHVARLRVGETGAMLAIHPDAKPETWPILEQLVAGAETRGVRVSDAATAFLERRFALEPERVLGPGPLRGGHRLVGLEATGYGLGGRPLTAFVGRARELDVLQGALASTRQGRGQVVSIVGEPGVGKSRLLYEFTRSARMSDCRLLEAGAATSGRAAPYQAVIQMLRAHFQIHDRDDPRDVREKVTAQVLALDAALAPVLPPLLALLDVPPDDPAWQALDPPQLRDRTLQAIKRLILGESQTRPVIVVVEDLHWTDPQTEAVLDGLVGSLPTAQVLLLVSHRPEYRPGWATRTYYTQLRLDPLPPDYASELLDGLLGDHLSLKPLKAALIARTDGNPFFLEELVRSLREAGGLAGERGAERLESATPSIEVPPTVEAVLAARLSRLPPAPKRLLQVAAVVGKDVPLTILRVIADLGDPALRGALMPLQAAELLYEASATPDPGYTFKHALTHEVAYESVLPPERRAIHAQIVDAIERLYPDRLIEHVETLAYHAVQGEVRPKAVSYLHQAGAKALARSANREAAAFLEQALAAQTHLPETHDTRGQAIDLRLDLRHALFPLGELSRVLVYLQEAERLAASRQDAPRLGWAGVYLSHYFWVMGKPGQARRWAEDAQAIAQHVGDRRLQVAAMYYLAGAYGNTGAFPVARDLLKTVTRWCEGELSRDRCGLLGYPAVVGRSQLAWNLAHVGAFAEARAYAEEGLRVAEELEHPFSLVYASQCLGEVHALQGDCPRAIQTLDWSLRFAREWNVGHLIPFGEVFLGSALALSERVTDGLELLQQAVTHYETSRQDHWLAMTLSLLGEAYLLDGRPEEARAAIERALKHTRENEQRWREAQAIYVLAQISAHAGPPDLERAEVQYGEALALATEFDMRPLVAHCHLGLGNFYRRTGKPAQTQEHLTTAVSMYREMDMGFWLAQAEAALAT